MQVTMPIRLAETTDRSLPKNRLDAKCTANILKSSRKRKIRVREGRMNNNVEKSLRGFWRMLAGIGVLVAVAGFQSTTSFANDGWKAEWEKVLAAAR
jgi:hypothetical protein